MPKETWEEKAKRLKTEVYALCLAMKDPRVPWYTKLLMALIIGYAISPIDLIPDFIPVIRANRRFDNRLCRNCTGHKDDTEKRYGRVSAESNS